MAERSNLDSQSLKGSVQLEKRHTITPILHKIDLKSNVLVFINVGE